MYYRGLFVTLPITLINNFSEIEAQEACKWLRAAGFPQYAQMYEGKYLDKHQKNN